MMRNQRKVSVREREPSHQLYKSPKWVGGHLGVWDTQRPNSLKSKEGMMAEHKGTYT